jgi:hypothetical protein
MTEAFIRKIDQFVYDEGVDLVTFRKGQRRHHAEVCAVLHSCHYRFVVPSLHVGYKNTRIKQYHKEGQALRTETTINEIRDFAIGRWYIEIKRTRSHEPEEYSSARGRRKPRLMAFPTLPEFQLAVACAIWPPSERRIEAIQAAAAGPLDWARFVRVIMRHRVVGLVHDGLSRAQANIPQAVGRQINARATTLVRENLAMAAEAVRLQNLFEEANLPVLFLKGTSLAVLAFGNVGLSGGQDIDLLVPRETLPGATVLMARAGYRRYDPPSDISDARLQLVLPLRKDLGFVHRESGLPIELHWRLFLNPHAMPESSILAASRVAPLNGATGLRTMGEEDLFAYLCMHGALHWWNRLKWLADVNALLTQTSESGLERLVRAAEARGAGRAAAQALLLCRRVMGTPLPAPLMATLGKGRVVRWLETTALKAMTSGNGEGDPHDTRFGTTRGSLSTFLLNRSWRYRLAELKVQLTNQTDVLTVPLPERLRLLYPVLRPVLWMWRHAVKSRRK